MPGNDALDLDEWITPEGHLVCPYIGVPLTYVQRGVATWFNDYLVTTAGRDIANADVLSRISAQYGEFEGIHADAVYIKMRRPRRMGGRSAKSSSIAILRIADHDTKQKNFGVETRTLPMDDVITWTLKGETMGPWSGTRDEADISRKKKASDSDVIFTLRAEDAEAKIGVGVEMLREMLNSFFESNDIDARV